MHRHGARDLASTQSAAPFGGRARGGAAARERTGEPAGWTNPGLVRQVFVERVFGFFEFGELTSPTGSLNGDAFRRALGRVSQSRRSVTFPCERCRLAEVDTLVVTAPGLQKHPGSCSFDEGDVVGIGCKGQGVVTMFGMSGPRPPRPTLHPPRSVPALTR